MNRDHKDLCGWKLIKENSQSPERNVWGYEVNIIRFLTPQNPDLYMLSKCWERLAIYLEIQVKNTNREMA